MIQQVNLYQDSLKPGQNPAGLNSYTGKLLVATLIGCLFSAYFLWELHSAKQQLAQIQLQLANVKDHTNQIIASHPKQELDPLLAEQAKQLQTSTGELKQALALLNNKNSAWPDGFSKYFEAFGNQAVSEVWLTSIYIDEQKQLINLEGSTFKADKIAYFLQQLQKEPIFEGQSFARMVMLESEKNPGQLDFNLSTNIEPIAKQDHAE